VLVLGHPVYLFLRWLNNDNFHIHIFHHCWISGSKKIFTMLANTRWSRTFSLPETVLNDSRQKLPIELPQRKDWRTECQKVQHWNKYFSDIWVAKIIHLSLVSGQLDAISNSKWLQEWMRSARSPTNMVIVIILNLPHQLKIVLQHSLWTTLRTILSRAVLHRACLPKKLVFNFYDVNRHKIE
jgi:hypothetical protein